MGDFKRSKNKVLLEEFGVSDTSAGDWISEEEPWSIANFKKNFRLEIANYDATNMELEFDIIGIHAAIANSFRRILLSEVPSMAIEKVHVYNNTSIIQDEVFAHRLGLVPLKADPRRFEFKSDSDADPTELDTLEFELKIKCTWNSKASKDSAFSDDLYKNNNVYTKHIKWVPIGGQADVYTAKDVGPVQDDVLLNKLRPGHELDLKLFAVKGYGKDHAKFSPVATASYRLLPQITLKRDIEGDLAYKLQKCFSPGVIGIEEDGKVCNADNEALKEYGMIPTGRKKAKVLDARYDTCSRNVFRHDDLKDAVILNRVKDHFIFSIESVGALQPDVLFVEAIKVLKMKCQVFLEQLSSKQEGERKRL